MKHVSRSRSSPPGRYPAGAIATYGSDSGLATKLVVSVLERPGQRDPSATHTWTTQGDDVRHDPAIAAEVAGFLQQHGAKQSVTSDRDAPPEDQAQLQAKTMLRVIGNGSMTLAARIAVMRDGEIAQVGPPLEVFRRPVNAFVAGFVGSPAMNLMPGTLVRREGRL